MDDYPTERAIKQRYELLQPLLDERLRRLWAAAESVALGTGGVAILSKTTGLSRSTIRSGVKQLKGPNDGEVGLTRTGRVRKPGGGRKSAIEKNSEIEKDLESLMESSNEEPGPLFWTCKSLRRLAEDLGVAGHSVSYRTVSNILHRLGYSFVRRGDYRRCSLDERRESFCRIAKTAATFLEKGDPVLSVRLLGYPEAIAVSHLVTAGLLSWWQQSGLQRYPHAQRVLLIADRALSERAWTLPLEALAAEVRLEVAVVHFPPGAWRWLRSTRQVTCACSLLENSAKVAEIGAGLDLVLPGVRLC